MTHVKKFFVTLALIFFTATAANVEAAESNFETLAAGYVDGEKTILMLVREKSSNQIFFMPFDAETESAAFVMFDPKIYNFYLNKDEHNLYSPLMFVMATTKMTDTVDDALGTWNNNVHWIPVYALFDVRDGQIVFDAPNFYSAEETLTPSHCHSNIKNPIHTLLIETLMTKMPLLHEDVQAKNISLPQ